MQTYFLYDGLASTTGLTDGYLPADKEGPAFPCATPQPFLPGWPHPSYWWRSIW